MAQSTEHLITMVNEIANNLAPGKQPAEAAAATATHLRLYWSPAMREQLLTSAGNSAKLGVIAQAACRELQQKLAQ